MNNPWVYNEGENLQISNAHNEIWRVRMKDDETLDEFYAMVWMI